jgi:hypothetical protein
MWEHFEDRKETGATCKMPGCPWPEDKFSLCLQHLFETGRARHCAQCGKLFVCPDGHYKRRKYCSRRCLLIVLARRNRRVPLNPILLERLYVGEGKSLEAVGRRFGVSESAVQRCLAKLGIARRPRGGARIEGCSEARCSRPSFRPGNPNYHTGRRCRFHFLLLHARANGVSRRRAKQTVGAGFKPARPVGQQRQTTERNGK